MVDEGFADLYRLEVDLRGAPPTVNRYVKKAIEVTARNVKDDWRQQAEVQSGKKNVANAYDNSIDYDMRIGDGLIEAEIGPNLGRVGGSAGFLDEGGGGVQSAPQHAARDAMEANESDFFRGIEIAIFDGTVEAVKG